MIRRPVRAKRSPALLTVMVLPRMPESRGGQCEHRSTSGVRGNALLARARHVAEAAVPAPLSKHCVLVHLVRDLVEEAEVMNELMTE